MKKTNFIFISIKKSFLPCIFCIFTLCLVLFSRQNFAAAKNGLALWANSVVPSLFPFFIATELLGYTSIISGIGRLLNKIMRPLFNVPGEGAYALIMGIISGYPMGAKIVTKFRQDGICTKEEGERLLAFTNNSGPLFIIATVGISLFGDSKTGILLFVTHLLACISVGLIFRFWKYGKTTGITPISLKKEVPSKKQVSFSNLGEVLASSITSAVNTIIMIGGFVVIFSVVVSILQQSKVLTLCGNMLSPILDTFHINPNFAQPILTGIVELTNGVKQVSSIVTKQISVNVIICSFLLGCGGISVLLQVFSITSKSDVSIKAYIVGKLLHGTLAAFYTYIALYQFRFLNLDIAPVFSNVTSSITPSTISIINYFVLLLLLVCLVWYVCFKKAK